MEKTAGRVLKVEDVKLQGQFHLGIGMSPKTSAAASQHVNGTAQVRIVEKNLNFTILEITCSCGEKTHIRCDYGNPETK